MGECFQSLAAGRQRHIYPGIHSFALYIFFLSSSQTSSSTSSASSSPSISPLSSLHALPLSAPGRVANCAQLKAKWEWTIGERAWKCASVFCERGEEQEGGEHRCHPLSFSHALPLLVEPAFPSLLLNGRLRSGVSPVKTAAAAAPQAPPCWITRSEWRSRPGGDSQHERRSKGETRHWKSSPSQEERQEGKRARRLFVWVCLLLLSKHECGVA